MVSRLLLLFHRYILINVFAIMNRYFYQVKLNRLNTSKKEIHVSLFDHLTSKKEV